MSMLSVKRTLLRFSAVSALAVMGTCLYAQTMTPTVDTPNDMTAAIASAIPVEQPAVFPATITYGDISVCELSVLGDRSSLITGQVASWNYQDLPAGSADYKKLAKPSTNGSLAMGYALPANSGLIGEMMQINEKTFIRVNDIDNGIMVLTEKKPARTPYAIVVPRLLINRLGNNNVEPLKTISFNDTVPISIPAAIRKLADAADGPIMVLGWVEVPQISGYALNEVPSTGGDPFGENVYRFQDKVEATNAYALIMAYVQPPLKTDTLANRDMLSKYFGASSLTMKDYHMEIRVALINERPQPAYTTRKIFLDGLDSITVTDIFHVSENDTTSVIRRGNFMVLSPVENCSLASQSGDKMEDEKAK